MIVKCTNNESYEKDLHVGCEYEVKHEHNGCYMIEHETLGSCWLSKDRFVKPKYICREVQRDGPGALGVHTVVNRNE